MEKIDILERLRNYMVPIVTHFEILRDLDEASLEIQRVEFNKIKDSNLKVCNEVLPKIVSLLKAENEIGVSDATEAEHGVYADVRNLECVADSTDAIEHTSSAALETRIDSGNSFLCNKYRTLLQRHPCFAQCSLCARAQKL